MTAACMQSCVLDTKSLVLPHAGLAAAVLHAGIDKRQELRTSNWEAWPLSPEQQRYAALDVLASLLLYQVRGTAKAFHNALVSSTIARKIESVCILMRTPLKGGASRMLKALCWRVQN